MAFNPQSGITGSVTSGATVFAFSKWKVGFKQNLPKVNNFTSQFQQLVPGVTSGTVTVSGPYDAGNMSMSVGEAVTLTLGVNNALAYSVPGFIESIDLDDDVDDAARVSMTIQSSGPFSALIS